MEVSATITTAMALEDINLNPPWIMKLYSTVLNPPYICLITSTGLLYISFRMFPGFLCYLTQMVTEYDPKILFSINDIVPFVHNAAYFIV